MDLGIDFFSLVVLQFSYQKINSGGMKKIAHNSRNFPETVTKTAVHDHICLFYRTREEQFAAVMPFMADGLQRQEQCIYLADENSPEVIRGAMRRFGIDVSRAERSGQLTIAGKEETYLQGGCFDPDAMIAQLRRAARAAKVRGTVVRATGEMTWSLSGLPGCNRLAEYESKLNNFFPRHLFTGVCQYNLNRFPSEVVQDMIRTHPLIATRTMLARNYYYQQPKVFTACKGDLVEEDTLDTIGAMEIEERIFDQPGSSASGIRLSNSRISFS